MFISNYSSRGSTGWGLEEKPNPLLWTSSCRKRCLKTWCRRHWRLRSLTHWRSTTARGFIGCYRDLGEDWYQSIHRHRVSLGNNLERKHQVRTFVDWRQKRLGSIFSDKNKNMSWSEQTWRNLCWNWRWRSWVVMMAEQQEYSFSVGFVGDTQGYPGTAR